MSWSISATSVDPDKVSRASRNIDLIDAKRAALEAAPFDSWDDDVEQRIDETIQAISVLFGSPAFGSGRFDVSFYGNAERTLGCSINAIPVEDAT